MTSPPILLKSLLRCRLLFRSSWSFLIFVRVCLCGVHPSMCGRGGKKINKKARGDLILVITLTPNSQDSPWLLVTPLLFFQVRVGAVPGGGQHSGRQAGRLPAGVRGAAPAPAGSLRACDRPAAAAAGSPPAGGGHHRGPLAHHRPRSASSPPPRRDQASQASRFVVQSK